MSNLTRILLVTGTTPGEPQWVGTLMVPVVPRKGEFVAIDGSLFQVLGVSHHYDRGEGMTELRFVTVYLGDGEPGGGIIVDPNNKKEYPSLCTTQITRTAQRRRPAPTRAP